MHHRLLADAVNKCLPANLLIRLQDIVNLQDNVLIITHGISLDRLFKSNDLAMAAIIDHVLLQPGDKFLLAANFVSALVHSLTKLLIWNSPLPKVVIEVTIQRHWRISALHFQEEGVIVYCHLITLDQFVEDHVRDCPKHIMIGTYGFKSSCDELVNHDNDIAHEALTDVSSFRRLLLHHSR